MGLCGGNTSLTCALPRLFYLKKLRNLYQKLFVCEASYVRFVRLYVVAYFVFKIVVKDTFT